MNYFADIKVDIDGAELFNCLKNEVSNDERTKVTFDLKENNVNIHIACNDATALRAACNSITRLIGVFESAKKTGKKNEEH